jgi:hypothetical protein
MVNPIFIELPVGKSLRRSLAGIILAVETGGSRLQAPLKHSPEVIDLPARVALGSN